MSYKLLPKGSLRQVKSYPLLLKLQRAGKLQINKIFILFFLVILIFPNFSLAEQDLDVDFNPNFIISDFELEDYTSMDLNDIQYFLNQHAGILRYYITNNTATGGIMTATEIIYEAAQKYKINPKYLLTLLQKEQSLISNPRPTIKALGWAAGYAICDSCTMDNPYLQKYKGFYNQVMYAAQRNRFYIENKDKPWLFQKQKEYLIDGQMVIPYNQATACLYSYTPHINGNYNFWKIWNKWFTRKYPNGSILKQIGSSGIWLIKDNKRWPFITWTAFSSRYDPRDIIEVNYSDLAKYPIANAIKFTNYSYLKTPDKKIYLLDNDKLKPFASEEVLRYFGVNPEEVINIEWGDYRYYSLGEEINMNSMYPNGAVLKDEDVENVYYVKNGVKHLVADEQILETNYPHQYVLKVSTEELNSLEMGDLVKFKDGTLIKGKTDPAVYIISDGQRRPVVNGQTFENLEYSWDDILEVDDYILTIHELGDLIDESKEEITEEELLPVDETSNPL